MGERKATNKYYPPDFDPRKHRSLDAYHGSHALRERAKKIHEGILVIRFEMPYNIWCEGCNNHIGMGVRYNAEKSKVGMYYSTPIYKFRMKCHLCDNYFEIKTDPATHDYVIIVGARRKEQRWDPKENEQIVPEDKATQKKLALDAMYKLEHGAEDKTKSCAVQPAIAQLEQAQSSKRDDYLLNKMLRQKFRTEKKAINEVERQDKDLLARSSLDISLVAEDTDDIRIAQLLNQYRTVQTFDERQKEKRDDINSRPLFSQTAPNEEKTNIAVSPLDALKKINRTKSCNTSAFSSTAHSSNKYAKDFGVVRKTKSDVAETISNSDETMADLNAAIVNDVECEPNRTLVCDYSSSCSNSDTN